MVVAELAAERIKNEKINLLEFNYINKFLNNILCGLVKATLGTTSRTIFRMILTGSSQDDVKSGCTQVSLKNIFWRRQVLPS